MFESDKWSVFAALMAHDLSTTPSTGWRVQACGDAHLANFGAFATLERELVFDVNDFDETTRGPWEWDLKRLGTSVVLVGRQNRLSAAACTDAALAMTRSYCLAMHGYAAVEAYVGAGGRGVDDGGAHSWMWSPHGMRRAHNSPKHSNASTATRRRKRAPNRTD